MDGESIQKELFTCVLEMEKESLGLPQIRVAFSGCIEAGLLARRWLLKRVRTLSWVSMQ
jgi:hypothetical protein